MEIVTASLVLLLIGLRTTVAIPIDNGVEGDPEVECGPTSIAIVFNTRNTFDGHVYVKGRYDEAGCRSDENGKQIGQITLPFETCGVTRTRSLNPRGIFVSSTVVITFHPQFITKVDRAYRIQCFYMEADKTVSTQLEVSDLTTALKTVQVPMPMCRYEILKGGPDGEQVKFALIGEQVYHKWTCDSETEGNFCMKVHSCVVDDGKGDTVQLLNENGCANDKFLLNNLEYPTDLMAGQEAHVYKYADRSELFFQCQIQIWLKDKAGDECERPECPALKRRRRRADPEIEYYNLDVVSERIQTADIDTDAALPKASIHEECFVNFEVIKYTTAAIMFITVSIVLSAKFCFCSYSY
ncbi:hypothetical protein L596_006621 [Steinernema carpocapsae]|uniref:ZP domain-containing protein n=1 Tax=Steinernema carpocapsae TaxID=34508 RepID=A0A4U8VBT2_STECR|nr:hypothetical protein L596_006621 [Steinernema carpocapsae]